MRTIEDFIYTGNVKIIALPQREISDESVYPEVVGKTGKVVRISGEKVGVLIDGKENPTVDTSIFEIYIIQEHTKVF